MRHQLVGLDVPLGTAARHLEERLLVLRVAQPQLVVGARELRVAVERDRVVSDVEQRPLRPLVRLVRDDRPPLLLSKRSGARAGRALRRPALLESLGERLRAVSALRRLLQRLHIVVAVALVRER